MFSIPLKISFYFKNISISPLVDFFPKTPINEFFPPKYHKNFKKNIKVYNFKIWVGL